MTLEDLIAEGEVISRPSLLLGPVPTASGVVGYWGGERADEPNALGPAVTVFAARRHILAYSQPQRGPARYPRHPAGPDELVRVGAEEREERRSLLPRRG